MQVALLGSPENPSLWLIGQGVHRATNFAYPIPRKQNSTSSTRCWHRVLTGPPNKVASEFHR